MKCEVFGSLSDLYIFSIETKTKQETETLFVLTHNLLFKSKHILYDVCVDGCVL